MKGNLFLFCTVIVLGCAVTNKFIPAASDLPTMQQKVPGIEIGAAMQGYTLYKKSCSGCHSPHIPSKYSIREWEKVLPEMLQRAKLSSDSEINVIKNYLYAKSK
jgi:cytochrome c5